MSAQRHCCLVRADGLRVWPKHWTRQSDGSMSAEIRPPPGTLFVRVETRGYTQTIFIMSYFGLAVNVPAWLSW